MFWVGECVVFDGCYVGGNGVVDGGLFVYEVMYEFGVMVGEYV